ncbi:molybdenum cofactor biosysynthesis protein, partial [Halobacteriales archaeon QS_9_67_17]
DARFEGARACARCVVPSRDPDTGEPIERFRQRFVERREATLPSWAPTDAFDHYFTVMLITRVPSASHADTVAVDDAVRVDDA